MNTRSSDDKNKLDQQFETDPLMAVYNPLPPQTDQPERFYWQEPWHGAAPDDAIQSAFEG